MSSGEGVQHLRQQPPEFHQQRVNDIETNQIAAPYIRTKLSVGFILKHDGALEAERPVLVEWVHKPAVAYRVEDGILLHDSGNWTVGCARSTFWIWDNNALR